MGRVLFLGEDARARKHRIGVPSCACSHLKARGCGKLHEKEDWDPLEAFAVSSGRECLEISLESPVAALIKIQDLATRRPPYLSGLRMQMGVWTFGVVGNSAAKGAQDLSREMTKTLRPFFRPS